MGESHFRRKPLLLLGVGLGAALVMALVKGESETRAEAHAPARGPAAGLAAPVATAPLQRWRLEHANWQILAEESVAEAALDEASVAPNPWKGLDIGVAGK